MICVSVIIPVYNSEKYLNRCIDSVLAQTFTDFELILINDGSKDNSGNICDDYVNKDKRVSVIHKENGGVSSARNLGITKASGKYIMFVDSDDWLETDAIENLYTKANDCDLILGGFHILGALRNAKHSMPEKLIEGKQIVQTYIDLFHKDKLLVDVSCSKLFKRDIIEKHDIRFDTTMKLSEDTKFNIDFIKNSENISIVDKIIYNYDCTNGDAATKKYLPDMQLYYLKVLDSLAVWFKKEARGEQIKTPKERLIYDIIVYYCKYYNNGIDDAITQMSSFYKNNTTLFCECEEYLIEKLGRNCVKAIKVHDWAALAQIWNKKNRTKKFKTATKKLILKLK